MRLPTQPNQTPTPLFNPDLKDYRCFFTDIDGQRKEYVVPGFSIETFPQYIAEKIASQMADELLQKRGIRHNYLKDKEELLNTIYARP